jgi:hypothetical protein
VILLVSFEVSVCSLGQMHNPIRQQRDLHFRRTGVRLVGLVPGDNLPFFFCRQSHPGVATPISSILSILYQW